MGVEQLQLLIRFCNVCGLVHVWMVCDKLTGNFRRFDRRWRHPSNWWFTFLLVGYLGLCTSLSFFVVSHYSKQMSQLLTKVEIVATLFYGVNLGCLNSIPRLVVIHFRHLEIAFECLNRADRIMNKMPHTTSCTTRKRTVFGLSVIIFVVFILFFDIRIIYF